MVRGEVSDKIRTRNNPPIIGLTGNSGSGKGEVSRILSKMGFVVLDADAVSRRVTLPDGAAYAEVLRAFEGVAGEDGFINREKLGAIVFNDREKKILLEKIVHYYVKEEFQQETERIARENPPPRGVVWDAPLLFEAEMEGFCDVVWVVVAERETRLRRIMERDGIDAARAILRVKSQTSQEDLAKRADVVVENDGGLRELAEKVGRVLKASGL